MNANEHLLREVMVLVPHHIFAEDRDGRYLLTNQAAATCIGKRPQDIAGHSELEFSANAQQTAAFLQDDQDVIKTGQPKFIPEEPITYANGTVHYLQTTKQPVTPLGSRERVVMGVAVDIAERKRAEVVIQESELFARSVLDGLSAHVAIVNA